MSYIGNDSRVTPSGLIEGREVGDSNKSPVIVGGRVVASISPAESQTPVELKVTKPWKTHTENKIMIDL